MEKAMSRVAIFTDVSNLYYCVGKKFENCKLDYKKYLDRCAEAGEIKRAFAYGFQVEEEANRFIACLKHFGYEPKYKRPRVWEDPATQQRLVRKTSWGIGIAMDIVRLIDRLDTIIIGSSDPDLSSLIEWVKERGVRCIVLSCGISKELKEVADQWIEIDESLLETEEDVITT